MFFIEGIIGRFGKGRKNEPVVNIGVPKPGEIRLNFLKPYPVVFNTCEVSDMRRKE